MKIKRTCKIYFINIPYRSGLAGLILCKRIAIAVFLRRISIDVIGIIGLRYKLLPAMQAEKRYQ